MSNRKYEIDRNGLHVNESENSVYYGVTRHASAPSDRPFVAYASVPVDMFDIVEEYSKSTGFYTGLSSSVLIGYFADERDAAFVAQDFRNPEHLEENLINLACGEYRFPAIPAWDYPPVENAEIKSKEGVLDVSDVGAAFRYLLTSEAGHLVGRSLMSTAPIRKLAEKYARIFDPLTAARKAIGELAPVA